jgi:OPT family small oligopeptide transporter
MEEISAVEVDQKGLSSEKQPATIEIDDSMKKKVYAVYGRNIDDTTPLQNKNIDYLLEKVSAMSEEDAQRILIKAIEEHNDDPNFPALTMKKIKLLVQGEKLSQVDEDIEYATDLRIEAAVIHYHSPYPEVRAVTDPYDDPDMPVETFRSYFLGIVWMAGATTLNTFFSPRQPSISISVLVLQLILAPSGMFLARVLPDWGFTFRGQRYTLNPGPWSYKEQMFATILFTVANGPGSTYYILLVQKLPQYLDNTWVTFGYEILLSLAIQFFGFGYAGVLRRFVIYPARCFWPKVLPTIAMNRALLLHEKKENVHGWTITKYRFFFLCFGAMFLWFWIPNFLFQALHSFNWMTWISQDNFNLGMITGFYGGMGYNPIATFDWNVSGTQSLVTPFFSTFQQYIARVLSGLIIIAMFYSNMYWSAYMPINSAVAFANDGTEYNVTQVLTDGLIDKKKYDAYGPPFFSGANVFGQGAWFAMYTMTWSYVMISQWEMIYSSLKGFIRGIFRKGSSYNKEDDVHTQMMSEHYGEVPDWCFLVILVICIVFAILAVKLYPTDTPVWPIFAVVILSGIFLVPCALLLASANVSVGFNVFFQLLGGVWFAGNPEAQIMITAFGKNFDADSEIYLSSQKIAHHAKLPPRAVFRGQIIAVFINCFIFVSFLNWMVTNFLKDSLCTFSNPEHFVCPGAVELFASAVEYGAFGVKNMFLLYPVFRWCFLIGAVIGVGVALAQRYARPIRESFIRGMSEVKIDSFDRWTSWLSIFRTFSPPVFWAGALTWTNGSNLSYATNALYISFIFMYYIKRRYPAWFEKYNYILEAGFDVGVACSGLLQTLAFSFEPSGGISLKWWGNEVSKLGADYASYNQKAPLLPVPSVGYFGPAPGHYPSDW